MTDISKISINGTNYNISDSGFKTVLDDYRTSVPFIQDAADTYVSNGGMAADTFYSRNADKINASLSGVTLAGPVVAYNTRIYNKTTLGNTTIQLSSCITDYSSSYAYDLGLYLLLIADGSSGNNRHLGIYVYNGSAYYDSPSAYIMTDVADEYFGCQAIITISPGEDRIRIHTEATSNKPIKYAYVDLLWSRRRGVGIE